MEILLSVPPHYADYIRKHKFSFPEITAVYSDPPGQKSGSGGGTVNILWQHGMDPAGRRIIVHADGQSRRLPSYAPVGKSFIPFPVFKWGRGQHIDQTLLNVQLPLLKKILESAPEGLNTLIASGDALVWAETFSANIPEADVVCVGIWAQPEVAGRHGVFICPRHDPTQLDHMLQKPDLRTLQELAGDYLYLLDAGIWLLSDRALELLFEKAGWNAGKHAFRNTVPEYYDLYTDFGKILGTGSGKEHGRRTPNLTCRILPLDKGEFYHFGSNADLLRSTAAMQNRVIDQREIWHKKIKPAPEIFVQNSITGVSFLETNTSIWIENSHIPAGWTLHDHHILTGVPENSWEIELPPGLCIDFVPVESNDWVLRIYQFEDSFKSHEGIDFDPYTLPRYPVYAAKDLSSDLLNYWIRRSRADPPPQLKMKKTGNEDPVTTRRSRNEQVFNQDLLINTEALPVPKRFLSARELISGVNLSRLIRQRSANVKHSLQAVARNHRHSIFYQLDLKKLAEMFHLTGLDLPEVPDATTDLMTRIHDLMFRSAYTRKKSEADSLRFEDDAFRLMRDGMLTDIAKVKENPVISLKWDQILWVRSPLRLDLAGGWTDTPPYCILYGGAVVNMAVELNGQPPIQVYIRRTKNPEIIIHSIDLGVSEVIREYQDLQNMAVVGSAFSVPKAALMLTGFYPDYSGHQYKTLRKQLQSVGGGLDISLMVAVPKGSGLGTSSILASTLLKGLSDCCSLDWDLGEVSSRTLLLEQLLTTGGGWQDQIGGIYEGVKLIESTPGLRQRPSLCWAPDHLFTEICFHDQILIYYTGITRIAKHILKDIVRGMFLNSSRHLEILNEMKHHARITYNSLQRHDWQGLNSAIAHSWKLNQMLDSGTNPPAINNIIDRIKDYTAACKLLGAGGGGYLMIFAKDPKAAGIIKSKLIQDPPNPQARFVDWNLSYTGLEITKS
ncbi:MAG TPA: bifunctional fucokinase/fucose-1-phosphate guanylyltransferase [Bacteroidales bacterium]|nr:bifunctional fucokinase/fucose-1-phosphate guanylyltransferase [Bacteroidales bacterium]HPS50160.1 bifunctional fucokinase/fucose-1-phosphate guanylyltransferase [Bacteroidales bacterium]